MRRITKLHVGNRKFEVGVNGVTLIEVQPPLAGVDHENGVALSIYSAMEPMIWHHEEAPDIVVPTIVPPDVGVDNG